MEGGIIRTSNLMRSSPTLSLSHSSPKQANAELLDAITHALQNPNDKMNGLVDERTEYEITTKLFFLPNAPSSSPAARAEFMHEAVGQVQASLSIEKIDLLILSFPDIVLDADDTDEFEGSELQPILEVFDAAAKLVNQGLVGGLGVAEFSAVKLRQLCGRVGVLPVVNQINLKDCCVTPRDLIVYAKQMGIKLFTHGDARDMLPTHSLRESLQKTDRSAPDGQSATHAQVPKWVCKYTAVASTRGVVENKGYIVALEE